MCSVCYNMKYKELFWDVLLAKAVDLTRCCLKREAQTSVVIAVRKTVHVMFTRVSECMTRTSIHFILFELQNIFVCFIL